MSEDYTIQETQHQSNDDAMLYINQRFEEQNQHISDIRNQMDTSLNRMESMLGMLMQQFTAGNSKSQLPLETPRPKKTSNLNLTPMPGGQQYYSFSPGNNTRILNDEKLPVWQETDEERVSSSSSRDNKSNLHDRRKTQDVRQLDKIIEQGRRLSEAYNDNKQKPPDKTVLEYNSRKIASVRDYFKAEDAVLKELTFENFSRWNKARMQYERLYKFEWDQNWPESLDSSLEKTLRVRNFTPDGKRVKTHADGLIAGLVFISVERMITPATYINTDSIWHHDTKLIELDFAKVLALIQLIVTPETRIDFENALVSTIHAYFNMNGKGKSILNFHKKVHTSTENITIHYPDYILFIDKIEEVYKALLELQATALQWHRDIQRPYFEGNSGMRETIINLCNEAGAKYLVILIKMIKESPTEAVLDAMAVITAESTSQKPRESFFSDREQKKHKVESTNELLFLLRAELDSQIVLGGKAYKQQQAITAPARKKKSSFEDSVNALSYANNQSDSLKDRTLGNLSTFSSTPVTFSIDDHDLDSNGSLFEESMLEVLVKPPDYIDLSLNAFDTSRKALLSNKPVLNNGKTAKNWNDVCYRALMDIECNGKGKNGTICAGHTNKNPEDISAAFERMIARIEKQMLWNRQCLDALRKNQRDHMHKHPRRTLNNLYDPIYGSTATMDDNLHEEPPDSEDR